jgi:metallo-beta-lactamase family protein
VLFVGYQAPARGRALVDGASTVSITAGGSKSGEIVRLDGLSAHADSDELVRWCRALPAPPTRVFLNHGEDAPRKALAAALAEAGWPRPALPLAGDIVEW